MHSVARQKVKREIVIQVILLSGFSITSCMYSINFQNEISWTHLQWCYLSYVLGTPWAQAPPSLTQVLYTLCGTPPRYRSHGNEALNRGSVRMNSSSTVTGHWQNWRCSWRTSTHGYCRPTSPTRTSSSVATLPAICCCTATEERTSTSISAAK